MHANANEKTISNFLKKHGVCSQGEKMAYGTFSAKPKKQTKSKRLFQIGEPPPCNFDGFYKALPHWAQVLTVLLMGNGTQQLSNASR